MVYAALATRENFLYVFKPALTGRTAGLAAAPPPVFDPAGRAATAALPPVPSCDARKPHQPERARRSGASWPYLRVQVQPPRRRTAPSED